MFSTQSDNCIPICPYFDIISLCAAEFEEPKDGTSGKGFIELHLCLSDSSYSSIISEVLSVNRISPIHQATLHKHCEQRSNQEVIG